MHSLYNRVTTISFNSVLVLGFLATLSWVTTFWLVSPVHVARLQVAEISDFSSRGHHFFRDYVERALIRFDLDADFRAAFNWNVRQIFVYVVAEYETKGGAVGRQVIWDRILPNATVADLHLSSATTEYPLMEPEAGIKLANSNVTLSLHWDVMPITGGLLAGHGAVFDRIRLPKGTCSSATACKWTRLPTPVAAAPAATPDETVTEMKAEEL